MVKLEVPQGSAAGKQIFSKLDASAISMHILTPESIENPEITLWLLAL